MFEKYFVTCPVAVALREAGFNESCMASWEHSKSDGALTAFEQQDKFRINYSSEPQDPRMLSQELQRLVKERPGIFERKLKNSDLPPYLYAAPLYDQALEWLLTKGLYLHPYLLHTELNIPDNGKWGVNIFNQKGNMVWPEIALQPDFDTFEKDRERYLHIDKAAAVDQAILAAIKLLQDEPKVDV